MKRQLIACLMGMAMTVSALAGCAAPAATAGGDAAAPAESSAEASASAESSAEASASASDFTGEDPQLEKHMKISTIWAEDNDNGVLINKI